MPVYTISSRLAKQDRVQVNVPLKLLGVSHTGKIPSALFQSILSPRREKGSEESPFV